MLVAWLLLQLAVATFIILQAATRLTHSADVIADKTGWGRSFVGVLLLATATSLPEMGTGVSSVVFYEAYDIALGAAFGSNLFNLLIIFFLDFAWRRGPILGAAGHTSKLVAEFGIVIIAMCSIAVVVGRRSDFAATWPLSPMSIVILGVFVVAMWAIYRSDGKPADHATAEPRPDTSDMSLQRAWQTFAVAALFVIGASVWLAHTGDALVKKTGLDASFVGTLFLALCTSLPEMATSFAALRIGAPELAVTNVLGSNLFNMGFVLVLNDAVFTRGSIWSEAASVHTLTGIAGIAMTLVVLYGLRRRDTTRRVGLVEAIALPLLYVVASYVVYRVG